MAATICVRINHAEMADTWCAFQKSLNIRFMTLARKSLTIHTHSWHVHLLFQIVLCAIKRLTMVYLPEKGGKYEHTGNNAMLLVRHAMLYWGKARETTVQYSGWRKHRESPLSRYYACAEGQTFTQNTLQNKIHSQNKSHIVVAFHITCCWSKPLVQMRFQCYFNSTDYKIKSFHSKLSKSICYILPFKIDVVLDIRTRIL